MSNKDNQNCQIQKLVIASEARQSAQYGFQLKPGSGIAALHCIPLAMTVVV